MSQLRIFNCELCNHSSLIINMHSYIAILRGINVSGQKMIKMEALRQLFENLGFAKVKTYIQSGNVVFLSDQPSPADLEKQISTHILAQFGYQVPVLVIEKTVWESVFKNNPFVNQRNEDIGKLHVTFLAANPAPAQVDKIKDMAYPPDEFILAGNAVYLFCPNGYGNTKLSNTFFENKLKVSATTRNWKTVQELLNMAEQASD